MAGSPGEVWSTPCPFPEALDQWAADSQLAFEISHSTSGRWFLCLVPVCLLVLAVRFDPEGLNILTGLGDALVEPLNLGGEPRTMNNVIPWGPFFSCASPKCMWYISEEAGSRQRRTPLRSLPLWLGSRKNEKRVNALLLKSPAMLLYEKRHQGLLVHLACNSGGVCVSSFWEVTTFYGLWRFFWVFFSLWNLCDSLHWCNNKQLGLYFPKKVFRPCEETKEVFFLPCFKKPNSKNSERLAS